MSTLSPIALSPLLAFMLSVALLTVALGSGVTRYLAMDRPNQRSLHVQPVPRIGGIAIVIATLIAWTLTGTTTRIMMALTAGLAVMSYIDDWKGLSVLLRLVLHGCAALALVLFDLAAARQSVWIAVGLVMFVVWMTNANNFMDGADGLAGGMAMFGFSAYGVAAWSVAVDSLAATSFAVAAAACGFLLFNFPPAKVFMGDAGSIPLGFLSAALGIMGWQQNLWPLWFPVLLFSPFLLDASVTLARRVIRGERFWQAHREHYYQRLIRMGWGHRRTALAEYLLMAAVALSALLGLRFDVAVQLSILAAWMTAYIGMMLAIDRRWQSFVQATGAAR